VFVCFTLTFTQVSSSVGKNSDESINEILRRIVEKFEEISYEYSDNCNISIGKSGGVPKVKIWYANSMGLCVHRRRSRMVLVIILQENSALYPMAKVGKTQQITG